LTCAVFLALLGSLIFLPGLAAQEQSEKEDTALFYEGQSFLDQKKPGEAVKKFRELLDRFPKSNIRDLGWYWLAVAYSEMGRPKEAEEGLKNLKEEFPNSPLVQRLTTQLASKAKPPVAAKPPAQPKAAPPPEKTVKKETPASRKAEPPSKGPSTRAEAPKALTPRTERPPAGAKETLPAPTSKGFVLMITQVADLKVETTLDRFSIYPGETTVIPFRVTNLGNAEDGFRLSVGLSTEYQPVFYADENGNGRLDSSEKPIQAIPAIGIQQSFATLLQVRLPHTLPDGMKKEVEISVSSIYDPNVSQLAKAALVAKGPQLRGEFSASREKVQPGETVSYTLTIGNGGSAEARDVRLQYAYHPNLIFLSAQPTPSIVEQATRTLVWNLGDLQSQANRRMEVTFKVGDEAMAGIQLLNRGAIESAVAGESVSFVSPLVVVQQVAAVKVETAREDIATTPGDILYLPVTIKNLGNGADSFSIQVEGAGPAETVIFADLNRDGVFQGGEPQVTGTPVLGSRESFPALVRLMVPSKSMDGQKIEVRVTALSNLDRKVVSRVARMLYYTLPIVSITTQLSTRESIPGGIISYQLTAINSGSGTARNVMILDLLPKELEYVNSDPPPSQNQEGRLVWQLDELAPNQKKVFVVNVKARPGLRAGTQIQKSTEIRYTDLNGNRYE
jgi:uncharacterized repeat protein (TIGR01451 family)